MPPTRLSPYLLGQALRSMRITHGESRLAVCAQNSACCCGSGTKAACSASAAAKGDVLSGAWEVQEQRVARSGSLRAKKICTLYQVAPGSSVAKCATIEHVYLYQAVMRFDKQVCLPRKVVVVLRRQDHTWRKQWASAPCAPQRKKRHHVCGHGEMQPATLAPKPSRWRKVFFSPTERAPIVALLCC